MNLEDLKMWTWSDRATFGHPGGPIPGDPNTTALSDFLTWDLDTLAHLQGDPSVPAPHDPYRTLPDDAWMVDALCDGRPMAEFFPARGQTTTAARALCAECPVRVECLNFAQALKIQHGVWGGTTPEERRA